MKKMEISFSFHISNGEWEPNKKIVREYRKEHEIDLDLFNDQNTFECVKATLKREFEDGIEKAINTVMQRMIDDKPDALYDKDGNAYADSCGGPG